MSNDIGIGIISSKTRMKPLLTHQNGSITMFTRLCNAYPYAMCQHLSSTDEHTHTQYYNNNIILYILVCSMGAGWRDPFQ